MLEFRPYQIKAKEDCLAYLDDKRDFKRAICIAPTAFGKSLLIGFLAKHLQTPVLVLQPTSDLLKQNFDKLIGFGGNATIYSASMGMKIVSHCTFVTPKSIVNDLKKFKDIGLKTILIDECHLQCGTDSIVDKIVKYFGNVKVIGFSASPIILKQGMLGSELKMLNRTRDSLFQKIIHCTQIKELTDNGYWSKLNYDIHKQDSTKLVLNTSGNEFTDGSIRRYYFENDIQQKIVDVWKDLEDKTGTLIFVHSIASANELQAKLGDSTQVIHSDLTTKLRHTLLEDFKNNLFSTLININIGGVGFDKPDLKTIIHANPTNSCGRWYQNIGRLVRVFAGKKFGTVIDLSGNFDRFGRIEDFTFENIEGYGWGMFSGDWLLTNSPLCLPKIKKSEIVITKKKEMEFLVDPEISFGKYKGDKLSVIAKKDYQYLVWLSTAVEFEWNKVTNGNNIYEAIKMATIQYSSH